MTINCTRLVGLRNPTFTKKSGFLVKLQATINLFNRKKFLAIKQKKAKIAKKAIHLYNKSKAIPNRNEVYDQKSLFT
jgi:hypothetical protein